MSSKMFKMKKIFKKNKSFKTFVSIFGKPREMDTVGEGKSLLSCYPIVWQSSRFSDFLFRGQWDLLSNLYVNNPLLANQIEFEIAYLFDTLLLI